MHTVHFTKDLYGTNPIANEQCERRRKRRSKDASTRLTPVRALPSKTEIAVGDGQNKFTPKHSGTVCAQERLVLRLSQYIYKYIIYYIVITDITVLCCGELG